MASLKKIIAISVLLSLIFFAGCTFKQVNSDLLEQSDAIKGEDLIAEIEEEGPDTEPLTEVQLDKEDASSDEKENVSEGEEPQESPLETIEEEAGPVSEEGQKVVEEEQTEMPEEPEEKAPSVELIIIEGPLYTEDKVICYFRVKAVCDGHPKPEISFSKDDSDGAWGNDVAQINLVEGESYELVALARNEVGSSQDTLVLDYIGQEGDTSQVTQAQDIDYNDIENLLIDVDLTKQEVNLFYMGSEVKKMVCSGGMENNPTPLGYFKTSQKIYYAWLPKYDVGVYHIVRFIGSYLFHSVPFDAQGNMISEEYQKLGQPASHGCIRLSVEDAKWLYDTLPLGVSVFIHY